MCFRRMRTLSFVGCLLRLRDRDCKVSRCRNYKRCECFIRATQILQVSKQIFSELVAIDMDLDCLGPLHESMCRMSGHQRLTSNDILV
jgi:hypothetical protein